MTHLIVDDPEQGIKRITLNRPQQLNAFTFEMYAQLIEVLRALQHDSKTRVVLLTGSGKGFCAGHDLKAAGEPPWIDDAQMGKAYAGKHSLSEIGMIPSLIRHLPQENGRRPPLHTCYIWDCPMEDRISFAHVY